MNEVREHAKKKATSTPTVEGRLRWLLWHNFLSDNHKKGNSSDWSKICWKNNWATNSEADEFCKLDPVEVVALPYQFLKSELPQEVCMSNAK